MQKYCDSHRERGEDVNYKNIAYTYDTILFVLHSFSMSWLLIFELKTTRVYLINNPTFALKKKLSNNRIQYRSAQNFVIVTKKSVDILLLSKVLTLLLPSHKKLNTQLHFFFCVVVCCFTMGNFTLRLSFVKLRWF